MKATSILPCDAASEQAMRTSPYVNKGRMGFFTASFSGFPDFLSTALVTPSSEENHAERRGKKEEKKAVHLGRGLQGGNVANLTVHVLTFFREPHNANLCLPGSSNNIDKTKLRSALGKFGNFKLFVQMCS